MDRHPNRGIDHLVLCVDRLDDARTAYERFGFVTTPRARHPFGTGNSLIQLDGNFIELLAIVAPDTIAAPEPGQFSFAQFNQRFAARRQGMSMLVFASADAVADQAEFAGKGLTSYAPFRFERQATLPDGSNVTVAFSTATVTDARLPEAGFFVCQQHNPEHFWKPEYQRHPNGAEQITEVIMVAPAPAELADLFAGLQTPAAVARTADGLAVTTARGVVTVMTPQTFAERFPDGQQSDAPTSPYFAGYRVRVADLDACAARLRAGGVAVAVDAGRLRLPPSEAFGMMIEFHAGAGR